MYKFITPLVFALLTSACGGGSSSNNQTPPPNNNNPGQTSNLAGKTWRLCNEFNNTSSQVVDVYTNSEFSSTFNTYTNNNCSGTPATSSEVASGTYSVGSTVGTSGGYNANEIDFHVKSVFESALPVANQYSLYDIYFIENDVLYYGDDRVELVADRVNSIDSTEAYILMQ
jgi:hypothetical protein